MAQGRRDVFRLHHADDGVAVTYVAALQALVLAAAVFAQAQTPANETDIAAWEEIAPGRFMPRRVRGSCHGRVLG